MFLTPLAETVLRSSIIVYLLIMLAGAGISIFVLLRQNRNLYHQLERTYVEYSVGLTPAGHVAIANHYYVLLATGRSKNPALDGKCFVEHLKMGRSEVLKIRQLFSQMDPASAPYFENLIRKEFSVLATEDVH